MVSDMIVVVLIHCWCVTGYSGWSDDEILCLKEGLRKYGRAWGKVYRELGTSKTASQCKQFYDDYCNDRQLDLNLALSEHIAMKVSDWQLASLS